MVAIVLVGVLNKLGCPFFHKMWKVEYQVKGSAALLCCPSTANLLMRTSRYLRRMKARSILALNVSHASLAFGFENPYPALVV